MLTINTPRKRILSAKFARNHSQMPIYIDFTLLHIPMIGHLLAIIARRHSNCERTLCATRNASIQKASKQKRKQSVPEMYRTKAVARITQYHRRSCINHMQRRSIFIRSKSQWDSMLEVINRKTWLPYPGIHWKAIKVMYSYNKVCFPILKQCISR